MRWIAIILFKLTGWKVIGDFPAEAKKCVMVGAPHTSNWDFIYARSALYIKRVNVKYLIKKELFIFPLSLFFRATGGIPVDRSKKNNLIDDLVGMFEGSEDLKLLFSPEGTRKPVESWKTGFYYLAERAGVPILVSSLDYPKKEASVDKLIYPTGDMEKDMKEVEDYYREVTGRHPENFNQSIFKKENN